MFKFRKITSISAFILMFVTGCVLYQKATPPKIQVPTSFKNANKFTAPNLNPKWWQNFYDLKLNQLVNTALKNNLSYLITLKNLQIARTYVYENASSLFPQAGVNYTYGRNKQSLNTGSLSSSNQLYNLYQLNGTVSYEVDVWGSILNSVRQAKANVQTSIADSNLVKLTLISNLVTTYYQISALDSNLANLHTQYHLTNEISKLNQDQYKSGLIDIKPVDDAKAQIENIKTDISNQEKQRKILQNTLAYLVGVYPEDFAYQVGKMLDHKNLMKMIPSATPSQLLINRPDIQSAFYQVLSFDYAKKQSLAAFLPTFTLTGAYGFASASLINFTSGGSLLWNFNANAVQTLFDFAKRASQYQRAKLQYEAAVLNYKNVVINGFQEVENALVSYQQDYQALEASLRIADLTKSIANVASTQYKAGVGEYLTYLEQKLLLLKSEYNVTNQTQIVINDIIQVYKTLGLGL